MEGNHEGFRIADVFRGRWWSPLDVEVSLPLNTDTHVSSDLHCLPPLSRDEGIWNHPLILRESSKVVLTCDHGYRPRGPIGRNTRKGVKEQSVRERGRHQRTLVEVLLDEFGFGNRVPHETPYVLILCLSFYSFIKSFFLTSVLLVILTTVPSGPPFLYSNSSPSFSGLYLQSEGTGPSGTNDGRLG